MAAGKQDYLLDSSLINYKLRPHKYPNAKYVFHVEDEVEYGVDEDVAVVAGDMGNMTIREAWGHLPLCGLQSHDYPGLKFVNAILQFVGRIPGFFDHGEQDVTSLLRESIYGELFKLYQEMISNKIIADVTGRVVDPIDFINVCSESEILENLERDENVPDFVEFTNRILNTCLFHLEHGMNAEDSEDSLNNMREALLEMSTSIALTTHKCETCDLVSMAEGIVVSDMVLVFKRRSDLTSLQSYISYPTPATQVCGHVNTNQEGHKVEVVLPGDLMLVCISPSKKMLVPRLLRAEDAFSLSVCISDPGGIWEEYEVVAFVSHFSGEREKYTTTVRVGELNSGRWVTFDDETVTTHNSGAEMIAWPKGTESLFAFSRLSPYNESTRFGSWTMEGISAQLNSLLTAISSLGLARKTSEVNLRRLMDTFVLLDHTGCRTNNIFRMYNMQGFDNGDFEGMFRRLLSFGQYTEKDKDSVHIVPVKTSELIAQNRKAMDALNNTIIIQEDTLGKQYLVVFFERPRPAKDSNVKDEKISFMIEDTDKQGQQIRWSLKSVIVHADVSPPAAKSYRVWMKKGGSWFKFQYKKGLPFDDVKSHVQYVDTAPESVNPSNLLCMCYEKV